MGPSVRPNTFLIAFISNNLVQSLLSEQAQHFDCAMAVTIPENRFQ